MKKLFKTLFAFFSNKKEEQFKEEQFKELINLAVAIGEIKLIEDYLNVNKLSTQMEKVLLSAIIKHSLIIKVSEPLLKTFQQFKGSEDDSKKLNELYLDRIIKFFDDRYFMTYKLNSFTKNLSIVFSLPSSFDELKNTLIKDLMKNKLTVEYFINDDFSKFNGFYCFTPMMERYLIKSVKEEKISYGVLYFYLSQIEREFYVVKNTIQVGRLPFEKREISGFESEMIILLLDSGYTDLYKIVLFLKERCAISPLLKDKLQSFKENADEKLQALYGLSIL
ncbi:MAG: hypothetical protein R3Y43_02015 [Alphaproteobacteria bacterium]